MAIAISVRDFRERVKETLPENTPIPSVQLVYLAFQPRNKFTKAAERFTGKLRLKLKVQRRQLSSYHPDAQYCATIFLYLRQLCIKFKEFCTLVCMDDKALIPLGEPGTPLATIGRTRATVSVDNVQLMAADHDTDTKVKVTPSTILIVDIPDAADESFCRGQVVSILKDTILQPSNPIRHMAELHKALKDEKHQPVRILYTDGGSDHNPTFPAVQLSLLALFLMEDLDVLFAARCCPGRSYTNPAEKPHCIMNLGLQGLALCREKMSPGYENKIKPLGSMKKIRNAVKNDAKFGEALLESVKPCHDKIADQFRRLSLKDTKFKVIEPATTDNIDVAWSFLTRFEPELKQVSNLP